MRLPTTCALAACTLALASSTALAQMTGQGPRTFVAGSGPDDMWEVTTKTEMAGMSMPGQTQQICIRKGRNVGEASVPRQDDCKVTEMKTSGNKTTFAMECQGQEPMTIRGETSATPSSFDSRMSMKGTKKGSDLEMTMASSGRKIGACTDQSEQVVANAKAQGQAEIAKVCADASDKFHYQFFAQGQLCEGHRKQFCDRITGLAPGMMKSAGFRAAVEKPGMDAVRGSFDACAAGSQRLDFDATARAACGDAVATRDWGFLGIGVCDAQVMEVAPSQCTGRDYYKVDRSLVPLCNRYAMLSRGRGGQPMQAVQPVQSGQPMQPAQPAQAEAQKPDAVKQGIDAVRKLLPF
jgi:hypothetical protein